MAIAAASSRLRARSVVDDCSRWRIKPLVTVGCVTAQRIGKAFQASLSALCPGASQHAARCIALIMARLNTLFGLSDTTSSGQRRPRRLQGRDRVMAPLERIELPTSAFE